VEKLQPVAAQKKDPKWSPRHWAVGIVHYEKLDAGKKPGLLVYLKASLTGKEPADVLEYKNLHPSFPHDTTANQFFAESQFESYRRLGNYIAGEGANDQLFDLIRRPQDWMDIGDGRNLEEYLKNQGLWPES
jgi:hypothetical protein